MPGKRYTEEEKGELMKLIRKMYADGHSVHEIGDTVGVSHTTVRIWLKADGVKLRKAKGRNKIEYDLEELKELASQGLTEKEIGKKMNAAKTTVGIWLKENGIEINLEARKTRGRAPFVQVKKCRTCIYRSGSSVYGCNYALIIKHSRRCPVTGCTVYKKGKRIRLKEEQASA